MININKDLASNMSEAMISLKKTKMDIVKEQMRLFSVTHKHEIVGLSSAAKEIFNEYTYLMIKIYEELL